MAVGISGLAYPFLPRHLTVVSGLTIGIPGFFLALAPGAPRARTGYVDRVLRFAVTAGVVAGAVTLGAFVCARSVAGAPLVEARTVATWSLLVLGLVVLLLVARPLTPLRVLLVAAMAGGAAIVSTVSWSRGFFALALPSPAHFWWALLVVTLGVPVLLAAVAMAPRLVPVKEPRPLGQRSPPLPPGVSPGGRGTSARAVQSGCRDTHLRFSPARLSLSSGAL